MRAAIEVDAALTVGVKNVPFNVPLLKGTVTVAVAVAFLVIDVVVEECFVVGWWLVVGTVDGMVDADV